MAADSGVVGSSFIVKRYGAEIDLSIEGKVQCPRCASKGGDASKNNLHCYGLDGDGEHKGAKCFACDYTIPSQKWLEENSKNSEEEKEYELVGSIFNEEVHQKLKEVTGTDPKGYRGIRADISKPFGVRYEYSEEDGSVSKTYYPCTKDSKLVGYKVRKHPKQFEAMGETGKDTELFGQFKFKTHTHTLLIVGGEHDQLAAFQMLSDAQRNKDFDPIAVVSPTVGESGAYKQIQNNYGFISQFKKVVVAMDNDDAGQAATEKLCKVLPRGKIFIMKMRHKDPNLYLQQGKEREFISDFWNAKPYTPSGIVSSSSIYEAIVERAYAEKLPFPPFAKKLNDMLAGGTNWGYILNVLAGSGSGKSSFINACTAFWMQELGHKVCVVSLEAEAGEYGENLLSAAMKRKIALIKDREERIAFVKSEEARNIAHSLFHDKDGTPLLYLLDDRGDYGSLQDKIEEVIISCDVRIIVIDVISDVFAGMSIGEIDLWMAWEKKLVKQYNCIICNISHTRKSTGDSKSASQGAFLTEESIIGSGTQYRSAGINIALQRDKTHEDPITRNSTAVHLLKSRATGNTGKAFDMFYDVETHNLFDKDDYLADHPELQADF